MAKLTIYGLSDLHIDSNPLNLKVWELLRETCEMAPPDLLLIAGDLAETVQAWEKALGLFSETSFQKIILPGNHDLWCRDSPTISSMQKHQDLLPMVARDQGWHYLPSNPLKIKSLGIAGSCCWYDYTLMPQENPFTRTDFVKKERKGRRWMDGVYCRWGDFDAHDPDQEITDFFYSQLENDLTRLLNEGCKTIFLMTHFPFYQSLLPFTETDWDFNYFGAFMGSKKYLDLLDSFPIRFHLCGHLHTRAKFSAGNTEVFLNPVGTVKEWEVASPENRLESTLLRLQV